MDDKKQKYLLAWLGFIAAAASAVFAFLQANKIPKPDETN